MMSLVEIVLLDRVPKPLTYRLSGSWQDSYRGLRVRVPLGRRRTLGVLWQPVRSTELPEASVRQVSSFVDLEPLVPEKLLELAQQVASYYLCPLARVFTGLFPIGGKGEGDRRIEMGAGSVGREARSELERVVREVLLERGKLLLGELPVLFPELPPRAFLDLVESDWLRLEGGSRGGVRYELAFELVPFSREERQLRLGRSRTLPQILELLEVSRRPLRAGELAELGVRIDSVRRLQRLGLVRSFDQPVRRDVGRHLLQEGPTHPFRLDLDSDQERAVEVLLQAVDRSKFATFLLEGPTGSGKTDVFLRAASACLERGGSTLLLVPEIALVPALGYRARELFGEKVAILHSGLSPGERASEWDRLRRGEAQVVVGPRSAIWAPLANVKLIVLDEEQDAAYKQDQEPRYHAREVALLRGRLEDAVVLLVSATPSLESVHGVRLGRVHGLSLRRSFGSAGEQIVVDLRPSYRGELPNETALSPTLLAEMERTLATGGQILLLRNRRGFAPLLLCRACGEDFRCPDCGLPMTLHRKPRALVCHWCGRKRPIPQSCPVCQGVTLVPVGSGTERVEDQLQGLFPGAGIGVLDRDHAKGPGGVTAILERFYRREIQILVGTQMLSKGHHFPEVALAAVLDADSYWSLPDFRAAERAYALFIQMAGRAGRGGRPGRFLLQTFRPDHYVVQAVVQGEREAFRERELRFRELFGYPPITHLIRVLSEDVRKERAEERLVNLFQELEPFSREGGFRLQGPAPAALEKLRGKWRFQLLLFGSSRRRLRSALDSAIAVTPVRELQIDVDPMQVL